MARFVIPVRTTAAIFIRNISEGKLTFRREPYNVVSIDYGDGTAIQTYVEPTCGRNLGSTERAEVYDEIRYYDSPPFPRTQIGYGAAGQ